MASYLGRSRKVMVSARLKQTDLATAQAVDCLLRVSSQPGSLKYTIEDDSDLVGGEEEPTTQEVSTRRYEHVLTQSKVKPHTLAFALAASMGTSSSSTPAGADTARLHAFTNQANTDFDVFTCEELYASGSQRKFIGCLADGFTLTGQRRNFFSLEIPVFGCGKIASGSASESEVSEVSLHTRDAVVFLSSSGYAGAAPTQDKATSALSSGSSVSARVETIREVYRNNTDFDFLPTFNSGVTWGRAERGTRSQELTMSLLFNDLTEANYVQNQTALAVELRCISETLITGDSTYKYGFGFIWPKVMATTGDPTGAAGDKVQMDLTFAPKQHATYGSFRAWVWNGVFDYLQ